MIFTFEATLSHDGWMGALLLPADIAAQLAQSKTKRVVATLRFNGKEVVIYAGVAKRKEITYFMFSKANQKTLNAITGDTLLVHMHEDKSKYQAPMTEELEAVLLSDYEAYELFEKLLPGKQRNIIFMVYNVKDSQKKVDLALNIMENLKRGNTDPFKFEKLL